MLYKKIQVNLRTSINDQEDNTEEMELTLSQGFQNYLQDFWKKSKYSPIDLLPDKNKPSFLSKLSNSYNSKAEAIKNYKYSKGIAKGSKNPLVPLFAGVGTIFGSIVKPVGKKGLGMIGGKMASATKGFKMDGPIKAMFNKIGIPIDDVKEEGEITVTGNDQLEHLNNHFFRCRGSKGVTDLLVFSTVGVSGSIVFSIIGAGAGGLLMSNPITMPIGCLLMAMGMKSSFESIVFKSPKQLASILISLARGIRDKKTDVKVIDMNGLQEEIDNMTEEKADKILASVTEEERRDALNIGNEVSNISEQYVAQKSKDESQNSSIYENALGSFENSSALNLLSGVSLEKNNTDGNMSHVKSLNNLNKRPEDLEK